MATAKELGFFKRLESHPVIRMVLPYALPCVLILAALPAQYGLQQVIPNEADFPYEYLYLIAIFACAWYMGYASGALAVLITMAGIPLIAPQFSRTSSIDVNRLVLFLVLSLVLSKVGKTQRKARAVLRTANDELDHRVKARTAELEAEIAGHRRTESALRESEERVAFALDAANLGRWDLDLVTGAASRSLRHDQIFGYDAPPPEWGFETFLSHVIPEDRAGVKERFEGYARGENLCEFECRIKRADQAIRWIWIRGKVRRDESGGPVSMLGITVDITDRKLAEQKLRTQIERLSLLDQITRAIGERQDLRSIFQVVVRSVEEHLPVDFACICLYDGVGAELAVACSGARNEALVRDLGLSPDAIIHLDHNGLSRSIRGELVYEPDIRQLAFDFPRRLSAAGLRALVAAPLRFEGAVLGILIAARWPTASFASADCEFLRQLSDHVALAAHEAQARETLQKMYEDLRQSQHAAQEQERLRALGQMASGIAHDINNALSPVALYAESLLAHESGLSARAKEYLETIQHAIEEVARTVGRMREFYRRREPELALKAVNLNQVVKEALDLARARWSDIPQQRGIVIHTGTELAAELSPLEGIEREVRDALVNLIFNAVDAMPEGGALTLRTFERAGRACVEVVDTGIGMDEETRRRCLEPFFTTKGERGAGLGLPMVYGVAQRLNAGLEIESAAGRGTTVRVSFRIAAPASGAQPETYETASVSGVRVLVIDDDPIVSKSLTETLEAEGHTVFAAHGGQAGIDACRQAEERNEPFAVTITDLGMPHLDGRKVAAAIKSIRPGMPVILLTGWGQRMEAEQEMPGHVDRVLNKPPKLHELRAALAELLRPMGHAAGSPT